MKPDFDLPTMCLVASGGLALALLGAVAALWPYAPNEQALTNFAFCLAVIFGCVLGNLIIFGANLTITKDKAHLSRKFADIFAGGIFVIGLIAGGIYFSEGLNAWFPETPQMPGFIIMLFRLIIFLPLIFLFYRLVRKVTKD